MTSDCTASDVDPMIPNPTGELQVVTFDRTPLMSTYLLALVVGRLDYIEATTPKGVKYRVYTLPGLTHQVRRGFRVQGS